MGTIGILAIFLSSSLCLYFVLALIRFVHKLWWNPIHIQHRMRLQGITGPSYRFLHGSNNEILNMKSEAKNRPMGLSHDMMSKVQPHIHSWVNKYGKKKLCKLVVELGFCVVFLSLIKLFSLLNLKYGFVNFIFFFSL